MIFESIKYWKSDRESSNEVMVDLLVEVSKFISLKEAHVLLVDVLIKLLSEDEKNLRE